MICKYFSFTKENFETVFKGTLLQPSIKFTDPFQLNDFSEFRFDYIPKEIDQCSHFSFLGKKGNELKNSFTVASFSTADDTVPLWSHYANNYKGFCIVYKDSLIDFFRNQPDPDLHYFAEPVHYDIVPPILDLSFENESKRIEFLKKICFTKDVSWSYENEFRILRYTNEEDRNVLKDIPRDLIDRVVLGFAMPDEFFNKFKPLNYKIEYAWPFDARFNKYKPTILEDEKIIENCRKLWQNYLKNR